MSGATGARATIVGIGRVGSVLARCMPGAARVGRQGEIGATERGDDLTESRRQEGDALPGTGAVWLCMPNAGVGAWLDALARRGEAERAICTQNGFFEVPEGATRALIYFAATDRSGACVVGEATRLYGPRAEEAAEVLRAGGIAAEVIGGSAEFEREVAIKTGWCHALGLIGDRLGLAVGAAAMRPELEQIAEEVAPILSAGGPIPAAELVARWRAYSATIPDYPARLRDRPWRTDPILARARAAGREMPLQAGWLADR